MSLNDDVQLNKAEKAWKPSAKKGPRSRAEEEVTAPTAEDLTPEQAQTKEILKRLRSILNKLTPQKFQELMNQVKELTIDSEERLKGAIDLIFEKAILEPSFSVAYANMCRCLSGVSDGRVLCFSHSFAPLMTSLLSFECCLISSPKSPTFLGFDGVR